MSITNINVNPTPLLTQMSVQKHHLEVLMDQMNLTVTSPMLAGRLTQFITNWEKITRWMGLASHKRVPTRTGSITLANKANASNKLLHRGGSTEVREILSKGAVIETTPSQGSFVSQIFLAEKKEGGQKPVINLRALNMLVKHEHFKMDTLADLI